jgi:hypothetical protein
MDMCVLFLMILWIDTRLSPSFSLCVSYGCSHMRMQLKNLLPSVRKWISEQKLPPRCSIAADVSVIDAHTNTPAKAVAKDRVSSNALSGSGGNKWILGSPPIHATEVTQTHTHTPLDAKHAHTGSTDIHSFHKASLPSPPSGSNAALMSFALYDSRRVPQPDTLNLFDALQMLQMHSGVTKQLFEKAKLRVSECVQCVGV